MKELPKIYEEEGSDCWFTDDAKKFLGEDYDSNDYEKLNDIVEVWFDSGSTQFCFRKKTISSGQQICILKAQINIEDGFIHLF